MKVIELLRERAFKRWISEHWEFGRVRKMGDFFQK